MASAERTQKNFSGNREHLSILLHALKKKDLSLWNRWRGQNPSLPVLLNGATLTGVNLDGINLTSVNLQGADLGGAQLQNAQLDDADLCGALLDEASLAGAQFNRAKMQGTDLSRADCSGMLCAEATISGTRFCRANLQRAVFDDTVLRDVDFTGADMCNSSLNKATLDGVIFTGANIFSWHIKEWHIKNIICEHVFIDFNGKERLPQNRDFKKGEFEGYVRNRDLSDTRVNKSIPSGRTLHHAYISSAPGDLVYVQKLSAALELHGIKVWVDRERLQPSVAWQEGLKTALDNGLYFIAFFSQNYYSKLQTSGFEDWQIAVQQLTLAGTDSSWFIPIKVTRFEMPASMPDKDILKPAQDLQWIDLTKGWNEGIRRIVQIILS